MSVKLAIETKLNQAFSPSHLEVINESHNHNVPENAETHFKLIIASESFQGLNAVKRQQSVYALLKEELAGPVHALSMQTFTGEEWRQGQDIRQSPPCLGGEK